MVSSLACAYAPHTCRASDCEEVCRFDGDGMLHAVRIKDGKASYSNAYVQTSKYKQEKKAGRPLFFTVTSNRRFLILSCIQQYTACMLLYYGQIASSPSSLSAPEHVLSC